MPGETVIGFGRPNRWLLRVAAGGGLPFLTVPGRAEAHVKWFAPFDVSGSPRPLADVLSADFWLVFGLTLLGLLAVCLIERTVIGPALLRSIDRISKGVRARSDDIFRAATAAFFVALWALGNVILTPELRTDAAWISWLQAAIAAGMFWRGTMVLSAIGIAVLFAFAVALYGPFHLADYPIFLGAAAYLALSGLRLTLFGMRPIDVARWGAGITLMWASVEKWAFPHWTLPLLQEHPHLAMGIEPLFYMTIAGAVEFVLAFSLLWTPLVRRISAIVLATMFVSAIVEFGKIDAIGHLMIIMMLALIAADDEPKTYRSPLLAAALYGAALVVFVAAYYGLHAAIFGQPLL